VGGSGKLDDKEAPKITITKVWEKQTKEISSMDVITGGSFSL
jgi:hypothetical protein